MLPNIRAVVVEKMLAYGRRKDENGEGISTINIVR